MLGFVFTDISVFPVLLGIFAEPSLLVPPVGKARGKTVTHQLWGNLESLLLTWTLFLGWGFVSALG